MENGGNKSYQWLGPAAVGLLVIITLLAYVKVFHAEFVYDDIGFIVNNKDIQSFRPFSKFFLSPDIFTGGNYAPENVGGKNWRPIASLVFAIEYFFFGANSYGFHFVSIILHLLNLGLVYLLVLKITKRIGIAALAAAFWAVHPTITEAVSWVSNQSTLIFFGFFILTALAILKYSDNRDKKYFIWFSYLFFILSLLTKETALGGIFVIPFVFLVSPKSKEKVNPRRILKDFLPFILIGAAYFYAHYKIIGALGDHALRGGFFKNLLLVPAVFYKYVSLAVYPVNLIVNYADYPLPTGIFDFRVIFGIILFVIFAALFYLGVRKSQFNFSLGIVWFLAFLSPVMQFIPFQDIIGERFLYAPLLGFFLAAILGVGNLFSYIKSEFNHYFYPVLKTVAALIFILFFILTFSRNNDWLNSEKLWSSALKVDPNNEKALNNLAAYYVNAGKAPKVIELTERLLKIKPEDISGNLNLGAGLAMMGRLEEAKARFFYVLSKKPDYEPALIYLAVFYQNAGEYDKALEIVKNLNIRYPDREDIKRRLLELQASVKRSGSPTGNSIGAERQNKSSDVEAEVQAPAVAGNIVNSGIAGRVVLEGGTPFEASLDVFKSDDMSKPFISVRSDSQGRFQIPLRPAVYVVKPNNPDGVRAPLKDQYMIIIGGGRWIQLKIEYK